MSRPSKLLGAENHLPYGFLTASDRRGSEDDWSPTGPAPATNDSTSLSDARLRHPALPPRSNHKRPTLRRERHRASHRPHLPRLRRPQLDLPAHLQRRKARRHAPPRAAPERDPVIRPGPTVKKALRPELVRLRVEVLAQVR